MNLKERAKQLKIDIPALFLSLKSKETPVLAKIVAGITVAYALPPIDLIPDFICHSDYSDLGIGVVAHSKINCCGFVRKQPSFNQGGTANANA